MHLRLIDIDLLHDLLSSSRLTKPSVKQPLSTAHRFPLRYSFFHRRPSSAQSTLQISDCSPGEELGYGSGELEDSPEVVVDTCMETAIQKSEDYRYRGVGSGYIACPPHPGTYSLPFRFFL
jgi:hypothetical protein